MAKKKKKKATKAKAKRKTTATKRKSTAKKKTKKKTTAKKAKKKTTAKKKATTAAKKVHKPAKITPADSPRTKSQIMNILADQTGLAKKDVTQVFDTLSELIGKDLGKRGPGVFNVPGLMKIRRVHKPAKKARKGINPFTGEETTFKAKPAHSVVKVRPLKGLKDMV